MASPFERPGFGDTGRTFEGRLFGKAQVKPDFLHDLESLHIPETGRFKSVDRVYDAFKRNYVGAGEGERGETSMSTDLRVAVEEALELEEGDPKFELRFYSAVGTVIDHRFGVDAFFELIDRETTVSARVTLDATLNKQKAKEGWKADVIIGELPDASQEEDAYLESIERFGSEIGKLLQERLIEQTARQSQRNPRRPGSLDTPASPW